MDEPYFRYIPGDILAWAEMDSCLDLALYQLRVVGRTHYSHTLQELISLTCSFLQLTAYEAIPELREQWEKRLEKVMAFCYEVAVDGFWPDAGIVFIFFQSALSTGDWKSMAEIAHDEPTHERIRNWLIRNTPREEGWQIDVCSCGCNMPLVSSRTGRDTKQIVDLLADAGFNPANFKRLHLATAGYQPIYH